MPISQAATVCVFDLADCACYARASDKLDACRFADFHHVSCRALGGLHFYRGHETKILTRYPLL